MSGAFLPELADLWRLAHRCGVKPAFIGSGLTSLTQRERKQRASPEAVLAALRSLGVRIDRADEAADAMRAVEQHQWRYVIDPIVVQWQGERSGATLRLPEEQQNAPISITIAREDGEVQQWNVSADERGVSSGQEIEGVRYHLRPVALPEHLPVGYHTLTVTVGDADHVSRLFVAPPRAAAMRDDRAWGVFIPLYALRSERSGAIGDLTDLQHLLQWARERGGSIVGTLPLLASYLDQPCDPSPYTPVSRLFFNELYLDVSSSSDVFDAAGALRNGRYVDFALVMARKRSAISRMAMAAFGDEAMRCAIEREAAGDPYLAEYARFRAVIERHGAQWRNWPEELHRRIRGGSLLNRDADRTAVEYHLYAQCQFREQLGRVAGSDHAPGRGLYLDLPVGVHRDGYDAWRFADSFAVGAACGAPPDELFIGGQNWGFAPINFERSRKLGHDWFIESVRRHLRYAGLLRIDHVMWMHRMYWVPDGFPATDGVYVRNPAPDEMYAILAIESYRHQAAIVGENLGTVPDVVNRTMRRRGISPLFVGQFAMRDDPEVPLPTVPAGAVASLNTHDTPTFAGYWHGQDIDQRVEMGLLAEDAARQQREYRADVRAATLAYLRKHDEEFDESDLATIAARMNELLGTSDAAAVLVTLEDLWQEERPQNVPGTTGNRNWSRSAALTMEQMFNHPTVLDAVKRLDRARQRGESRQ